ncbi:hypothetical protein COEREDRAFT_96261 [Coemansia reversa NRRL 1564]|uniref:HMG box domain-containing protein n=1 Tax=Coemansia reversa (strain ATCC 12441 / NRRL 1564) TaxID=763665 RepID=A0A2G5BGH7_COERN|nr:hypothetical protein COEREDRAFT_96261 [Coemansia reversa NRRL 1564]|eukprot:PIA18103.1 hypothetical protein COEREDRAFT_96261 [Coemansia reversa NRRL 1564]
MDKTPTINLTGLTQSKSEIAASEQQQQQQQQQSAAVPPTSMQMPTSGSFALYPTPSYLQSTMLTSPSKTPSVGEYTLGNPGASPVAPGHTNTIYQTLSDPHNTQPSSPMLPTNAAFLTTLGLPIGHSYSYQTVPMGSQPSHQESDQGTTTRSTGYLDLNKPKSKPRPPRNKSKFKRFRNAFIYFVNDQREKADDETKKLKNRAFLQLMSARWKNMSEEERRPYKLQADQDKKRYEEDVKRFGKYESQPRRYNRHRSVPKADFHKSAPYFVPTANPPSILPAAPNPAYCNGFRNIAPAQMGAHMAYPFLYNTAFQKTPPFINSEPRGESDNYPDNPQYIAVPNMVGTGPQQQQQFLAPPPVNQSNSRLAYASSNNPSSAHSPLDPLGSYLGSSPNMENNGVLMNSGDHNNRLQSQSTELNGYDISTFFQQLQQIQQHQHQQ